MTFPSSSSRGNSHWEKLHLWTGEKKERIEAEPEVQVDYQNQKYKAQIPLEKKVSDEEIKSNYSPSKPKASDTKPETWLLGEQ